MNLDQYLLLSVATRALLPKCRSCIYYYSVLMSLASVMWSKAQCNVVEDTVCSALCTSMHQCVHPEPLPQSCIYYYSVLMSLPSVMWSKAQCVELCVLLCINACIPNHCHSIHSGVHVGLSVYL